MPKPSLPFVASVAVGAACFGLLAATSPMLPMAWDEGNAIHRAEGIQHWLGRFGESGTEPFSKQAIHDDWRYSTQVEGHPAFYGTVIALGELLTRRWLAPLQSARVGPMALFAVAVAASTYRLWRMASPVAGIAGAAAIVTLPRLFAHAHFASFDGPLTSCWLLAWATFEPATRNARWSVVWGIALGATMSSKFTGWFAPLPFVLWVAAFGDRRAARALTIGVAVAMAAFWAFNPPLWHRPLAGLDMFLDLNLGRAERAALNIPTTYFGVRYDARAPLPWHNTLVWTAITVPIGTLALFLLGLGGALKRWRARPQLLLVACNWAILLIVRATRWAPPHDAERLFLPSFAFLGLMAGVGAEVVWAWASNGRRWLRFKRIADPDADALGILSKVAPTLRGAHLHAGREATAGLRHGVPELRWLGRGFVVAALAGAALSTAWYAPQWLSYYNLVIGGLRGADAAGMEATYYWDGLDAEVLDWLDEQTADDEKIAFASPAWENLQLLRQWGTLRRSCLPHEAGRHRWYVVQRRASLWSDADRRPVERERAAFRKTVRAWGWGPWRLDVPIIEVFSYDQYLRARD